MEQEQSKCDHARERKWKQDLLFFIRNNDSTTACIFAFGDSHDTLLTSWNSSDDRFAIFTAISCPQHLAPTRYTWLQRISTCPIFFCTRHTLHMCIVVYCQLAKVYYWQSAFNLALMNPINGHSLVLLIPNCSQNLYIIILIITRACNKVNSVVKTNNLIHCASICEVATAFMQSTSIHASPKFGSWMLLQCHNQGHYIIITEAHCM